MDADALFDALIQSKNDAIKLLQSSLQETRAAQTTLLIDKEKQEALIQKLQRDKQEAITAAERVRSLSLMTVSLHVPDDVSTGNPRDNESVEATA